MSLLCHRSLFPPTTSPPARPLPSHDVYTSFATSPRFLERMCILTMRCLRGDIPSLSISFQSELDTNDPFGWPSFFWPAAHMLSIMMQVSPVCRHSVATPCQHPLSVLWHSGHLFILYEKSRTLFLSLRIPHSRWQLASTCACPSAH